MPPRGCPSKASHASFHQPQRLFRLPSLSRLGLWTTSSLFNGFPREAITPTATTSRTAVTPAAIRSRRRWRSRPGRSRAKNAAPKARPAAEHEREREPGAVLGAHAARLAVLRDPGQGQGDRQHRSSRCSGHDERRDAVEALPRQREPEPEHDERGEDPPARVREDERDEERVEDHDRAGLDHA